MVDDLGYGDLGCYGQKLIKTPNIDEIASQGIRFTNYYSGSTVCAPSRESLLTGKNTGHTFIRGNFLTNEKEDPALPNENETIAEILKQEGYRTGLIGKWGLGGEGKGPETQGFDYSYGYLDQIKAHNYYPPFLFENGKKVIIEANIDDKKGSYSHNLFTEKTEDFINKQNPEQPFFLYLPYTIPHGKHVIPDNSVYENEDWPEKFKNYAAMITRLDRDIKDLKNQLVQRHLDKNTIIFFTSDNGANPEFGKFFNSNGQFRGAKRNLYEGGIRVPMIAYWPGKIKEGQVADNITAAWDFLPTISEIVNSESEGSIDGISFYNTLIGKGKQEVHPYLYWENYTYNYNWNKPDNTMPRNWLSSKAIRMGQWKLIIEYLPSNKNEKIELYNIETDKEEKHNVANTHPLVVNEIKAILELASTSNSPYFPYGLHLINAESTKGIKDFFEFNSEKQPMVSAHRGGPRAGFPENCISTFENTLLYTQALLEIDPRFTKDGQIILMHDATLDRTTNGSGKVSDYTLSELKKLRLKDPEGNLTNFIIPTLDEALQWAKGKTILVIDEKDVPMEIRMKKIIENNAESNAIVIAYSLEDIKKAFQHSDKIVMEVMMSKLEDVNEFNKTQIPWDNVVAFIGHDLPPNKKIIEILHKKGVMCIQGSSRNYDMQFIKKNINTTELNKGYTEIFNSGVDIIEADLGVEVGEVLKKNN
ncbi:sulfatase-like hydrolase/transferase [Zobellia uliginosa]|nr:sulfatase-like hydrolase/transferase [Zobellia uliginosa]